MLHTLFWNSSYLRRPPSLKMYFLNSYSSLSQFKAAWTAERAPFSDPSCRNSSRVLFLFSFSTSHTTRGKQCAVCLMSRENRDQNTTQRATHTAPMLYELNVYFLICIIIVIIQRASASAVTSPGSSLAYNAGFCPRGNSCSTDWTNLAF